MVTRTIVNAEKVGLEFKYKLAGKLIGRDPLDDLMSLVYVKEQDKFVPLRVPMMFEVEDMLKELEDHIFDSFMTKDVINNADLQLYPKWELTPARKYLHFETAYGYKSDVVDLSSYNYFFNNDQVGSVQEWYYEGMLPKDHMWLDGREIAEEEYSEFFEFLRQAGAIGEGVSVYTLPNKSNRIIRYRASDITMAEFVTDIADSYPIGSPMPILTEEYNEKCFIPAIGSILNISCYPELFEKYGTKYGGDGIKTFGTPDMRGMYMGGIGADGIELGKSYNDQFRLHSHTLSIAGNTQPSVAHHHGVTGYNTTSSNDTNAYAPHGRYTNPEGISGNITRPPRCASSSHSIDNRGVARTTNDGIHTHSINISSNIGNTGVDGPTRPKTFGVNWVIKFRRGDGRGQDGHRIRYEMPAPAVSPTLVEKTTDSVTVTTENNSHVRLGEKGQLYPTPHTFDGLVPGVSYSFYSAFIQGPYTESSGNSPALVVRIPKFTVTPPTIDDLILIRGESSITIDFNNKISDVEVAGPNGVMLIAPATFNLLNTLETYQFNAYYVESETTYESELLEMSIKIGLEREIHTDSLIIDDVVTLLDRDSVYMSSPNSAESDTPVRYVVRDINDNIVAEADGNLYFEADLVNDQFSIELFYPEKAPYLESATDRRLTVYTQTAPEDKPTQTTTPTATTIAVESLVNTEVGIYSRHSAPTNIAYEIFEEHIIVTADPYITSDGREINAKVFVPELQIVFEADGLVQRLEGVVLGGGIPLTLEVFYPVNPELLTKSHIHTVNTHTIYIEKEDREIPDFDVIVTTNSIEVVNLAQEFVARDIDNNIFTVMDGLEEGTEYEFYIYSPATHLYNEFILAQTATTESTDTTTLFQLPLELI